MNKKEIALEKAKQVLSDFKRDNYFPDTFHINTPEKVKERKYSRSFSFDVWEIWVDVPQEQFGGTGLFSIYIKDETMEPFIFHDGGAEGRTPDLEILKKDGKYVIGNEWKG